MEDDYDKQLIAQIKKWLLSANFSKISFLIFFLITIINVLLVDDQIGGMGGDNAYYILLSKAIVSGMGYTEMFTPGLPPHVQFPPVFPLLLSPIVHLWGYNFLLMHIFVIALGILAIWAIREIIKKSNECYLYKELIGFEPEITAKIAKSKYRIYEVGISYSGRDYSEGKKIGWKDGIRALQ